jgi:hypothetical protein
MRKTNICIFCVDLQKVIFACRIFLPKSKTPAKTKHLSGKLLVKDNLPLFQKRKRMRAKSVLQAA